MEEILSEIKNNLIDLYLKVKIRKTIETITIDSDFLDNEKKNLNKLSALDIIKYIKSHLQILIEIQVSEKINELKQEINENFNENNINNYEILLRRYEADIRNYIKIENMLKIHIDDLNFKIENLEKTIENLNKNTFNKNILEYQKKIDNLTNIVKNYEKSNLIIPELEKKIKFQKIELDKMDEYYKNKIKIYNKKIEKYEKNDSFINKKIQISNYNSYKSNANNSNNFNINNNTTLKKKKKIENSIISNNNDSSFLMITNNNFYNSPKFNTMTQRSLCNYDSCEKEKSTDFKTKSKKNYSSSKKNNLTKKIILQNKNLNKKALQKIPKSTSNIVSKKNSMIIDNNNHLLSNKNKKIRLNKSNNSNICRDLNSTLSNINIEKIPSCVNYINIYSTINNNDKDIDNKKFSKFNNNHKKNISNFKRCSTERKLFSDNLNTTLPPKKKSNSRSKTKSFVNKFI